MVENGESPFRDKSFTALLLDKLAGVKKGNSDINTGALEREAMRQVGQSLRGGDPIKGTGVTKSGEED